MAKDFSLKPLHAALMLTDATTGISYNLDNQRVKTPGRIGTKIVKRTVYRIEVDDDQLRGSILLKGEWNRVVYNGRNWDIHNHK